MESKLSSIGPIYRYSFETWQHAGFIPELSFRAGPDPLRAFESTKVKPKIAVINGIDIAQRGSLKSAKLNELADALSPVDELILSYVGRDIELDRWDVQEYHRIAKKLHVSAVIAPDEYVYASDYMYPAYQGFHLLRALRRMEALIETSKGSYEVIGLAFGELEHQAQLMQRLVEHKIHTIALPCGDMLKQGSISATLRTISQFLQLAGDRFWTLLLGVASPRVIRSMRPSCYSTSAWAYDAYHPKDNDPSDTPFARAFEKLLALYEQGNELLRLNE